MFFLNTRVFKTSKAKFIDLNPHAERLNESDGMGDFCQIRKKVATSAELDYKEVSEDSPDYEDYED